MIFVTLLKNRKVLMFAVLAAGALIMLLGRLFASFSDISAENADDHAPIAYIPAAQTSTDPNDVRAMEERLEEFLSLVEGAGRVRILIGISAHRETVFAVDSTASESFTREEDAQGGNREMSQRSDQSSTVLIPDRNGSSRPLVLRESEPRVEGIVIIAQGGADPIVRSELTRAAQAVLGLDAHRIQVLTMRVE